VLEGVELRLGRGSRLEVKGTAVEHGEPVLAAVETGELRRVALAALRSLTACVGRLVRCDSEGVEVTVDGSGSLRWLASDLGLDLSKNSGGVEP